MIEPAYFHKVTNKMISHEHGGWSIRAHQLSIT